jgi:hypothetical protein
MKKFRNIASLFDFQKDYQILGNLGQVCYLWGIADLVLIPFHLEEVGEAIRYGGAEVYAYSVVGDLIKIAGGIAMKYHKREKIIKEESTKQRISDLEKKLNR